VKQNTAPAVSGFVKIDTTTQGNWQGVYGAGGYNIANSVSQGPAYGAVAISGNGSWTWNDATSDPRALRVNGTGVAACYCTGGDPGSSFNIDITGFAGQTHQVALYLLDWDYNNTRSQTVQLVDSATGAVLDTRSVTSFSAGQYLVYNISGNVRFVITNNPGSRNAVLSGIFFGQ